MERVIVQKQEVSVYLESNPPLLERLEWLQMDPLANPALRLLLRLIGTGFTNVGGKPHTDTNIC